MDSTAHERALSTSETDREARQASAAALQDLLVDSADVLEFLHELARLSASGFSCRGTVHCGVTLRRAAAAEYTVASSGDTARSLDEVQYEFGDGPCLHALRTGEEVLVADTLLESRWRNYTAHITSLGVRSVYSLPLALEGRAQAALNLYAAEPEVFDHRFRYAARAYAGQASQALKLAVRMAAQVGTVADLQAVLASRTDIDLAVGIVMGQNRCGQQEAFDVLRRASNARNLKLREIAAEVVQRYNGAPAQTHFENE